MMAVVNLHRSQDMFDQSVWYGHVESYSSSHITIKSGPHSGTYYGNFSYDLYGNPYGVLTSYTQTYNGFTNYSVSGLSLDAARVDLYLDRGDAIGLQSYALSGNDQINGSSSSDGIQGWRGNDTLFGNGGNDILAGGQGNDYIDGGAGLDTSFYFSSRANYSVLKVGEAYKVSGAEGVDTLVNVERIRFADKSMALDVDGDAGDVYRLYKAAFNRAPDELGLGYWIAKLDNGENLVNVAKGFTVSTEFKSTYGASLTDEFFLEKIYQNVLGRTYDEVGFNYWITGLQSGSMTREWVLTGFSQSNENKANVIGQISNGFEFIDHLL